MTVISLRFCSSQLDENRDGIADVTQIDAKELAARRIMVLTKSINPENVSVALEGLTMATVAVLATLRVKLAKAITLGTAIGEVLYKIFSPFTTKALEYALPNEYQKWIPVSFSFVICACPNNMTLEVNYADIRAFCIALHQLYRCSTSMGFAILV